MIDLKHIHKEIKRYNKEITLADIYQYMDLLNLELVSRELKPLDIDSPDMILDEPYPNMFGLVMNFIKSKMAVDSPDKEFFYHRLFIADILKIIRLKKIQESE